MDNSPVRITAEETLSDNWYLLKKYSFDLRRRDGSWQAQTREVYDRATVQPSCCTTASSARCC